MPSFIRIVGGNPLNGNVRLSGAKNASLPLMCASLLCDEPLVLNNVPNLSDIQSMSDLLCQHGTQLNVDGNTYTLHTKDITSTIAPYELVSRMRASILVLGPLLARTGQSKVSLPGGCAIGTRPVDVHLQGLKKLGAQIELEGGYIHAKAPAGLVGAEISMPVVSVTATENLMMAASLARGVTNLVNAAREPEIVDLAKCLNAMGARITGAGTGTITIEGVEKLHRATHSVIVDRIEMGTYVMAALITGGALKILGGDLHLLPAVSSALEQSGAQIRQENDGVYVASPANGLVGVDAMTEPFPGFATDLQAQFMALMTLSAGASMITETIFENRFMHVPELCRMGANITVHGSSALVRGVKYLSGAPVMATDLRASVSLILAALAARGETTLGRVYHLDRGYEKIEEKLNPCGAHIERVVN
jgi:UDP-N-acetylglucosamine 1-carboxyvinyltransferase